MEFAPWIQQAGSPAPWWAWKSVLPAPNSAEANTPPTTRRNFNGRDIVRRCVEANAEYLVLWVRDGEFTFHDSKLLPKPASFGDRDVLREAADEARRHELPLIVYCQLQYPAYELRQHPEWKARTAESKPIDHLVCFNTPYTNVVKEVAGRNARVTASPVSTSTWWIKASVRHTAAGATIASSSSRPSMDGPLPKGVNWEDEDWDRMLQFRYATSDRLEKMLTDYVRSLDPGAHRGFQLSRQPALLVGSRPDAGRPRGQRRLRHRRGGPMGVWRADRQLQRRLVSRRHAGPAVPGRRPARRAHVSRPDHASVATTCAGRCSRCSRTARS